VRRRAVVGPRTAGHESADQAVSHPRCS
jgi:hypothetical protein